MSGKPKKVKTPEEIEAQKAAQKEKRRAAREAAIMERERKKYENMPPEVKQFLSPNTSVDEMLKLFGHYEKFIMS